MISSVLWLLYDFLPVFRTCNRIRIRMFLAILDLHPDPLVRGTDPQYWRLDFLSFFCEGTRRSGTSSGRCGTRSCRRREGIRTITTSWRNGFPTGESGCGSSPAKRSRPGGSSSWCSSDLVRFLAQCYKYGLPRNLLLPSVSGPGSKEHYPVCAPPPPPHKNK